MRSANSSNMFLTLAKDCKSYPPFILGLIMLEIGIFEDTSGTKGLDWINAIGFTAGSLIMIAAPFVRYKFRHPLARDPEFKNKFYALAGFISAAIGVFLILCSIDHTQRHGEWSKQRNFKHQLDYNEIATMATSILFTAFTAAVSVKGFYHWCCKKEGNDQSNSNSPYAALNDGGNDARSSRATSVTSTSGTPPSSDKAVHLSHTVTVTTVESGLNNEDDQTIGSQHSTRSISSTPPPSP